MTTLLIANKEMEGIIKKVNSLPNTGLLIKRTTQIIKNETKGRSRFLRMLWGTLGNSLLGNLLAGEGVS